MDKGRVGFVRLTEQMVATGYTRPHQPSCYHHQKSSDGVFHKVSFVEGYGMLNYDILLSLSLDTGAYICSLTVTMDPTTS